MSQLDSVFLGSRSLAVFTTSSITPAATAAASTVEQAFTVTGIPPLLATDIVIESMVAPTNAVVVTNVRINASGQVVVAFTNPSAGSLTFPAGPITMLVVRA